MGCLSVGRRRRFSFSSLRVSKTREETRRCPLAKHAAPGTLSLDYQLQDERRTSKISNRLSEASSANWST
ncbi:hypothetical protein SRHO_G00324530 [Serrasalmus rhombeus]